MDPDQREMEASLSDHIFTLDQASSAVISGAEAFDKTESKPALYVLNDVNATIKIVSWLEKSGEVLILAKFVLQGGHTWPYSIGCPEAGEPFK